MTEWFLKNGNYTEKEKWEIFGICLGHAILWFVGVFLLGGPRLDWIAEHQASILQITLGMTMLGYSLLFLVGFVVMFSKRHRTRMGLTPNWSNREIDRLESSLDINISHLQAQIDDLTRKVESLEKK